MESSVLLIVIEPEITPSKSQLPSWACGAETTQQQREEKNQETRKKKAAPETDTNNDTFIAIYS